MNLQFTVNQPIIVTYIYKPILVTIYPLFYEYRKELLRDYADFSTDEEYSNKSKGYKAYLIGTGHILKNVEKPFDDILNVTTAIIKKQKTLTVKTALLFVTSIILWDRM